MTDETWFWENSISVRGENDFLARLTTSSLCNLSTFNSGLQLISQLFNFLWGPEGTLSYICIWYLSLALSHRICAWKFTIICFNFPPLLVSKTLHKQDFYIIHEQWEEGNWAGFNDISGDLPYCWASAGEWQINLVLVDYSPLKKVEVNLECHLNVFFWQQRWHWTAWFSSVS